jgi:hypothetical protein
MGDLVALLVLGVLGWAMSRTGWPRAPLLIGFVLAGPMERYFVQTTGIYNRWEWLGRPGVLVIAAVLVAPFVWGLISMLRRRRAAPGETPETGAPGGRSTFDLVFSVAMLAIFAGALAQIQRFVPGARLMPLLVAVPGLALAAIQVVRSAQGRSLAGETEAAGDLRSGLLGLAALGGFLLVIWLAGFHVAAAGLMLFFGLVLGKMRPLSALTYTVAVVAVLTGLGSLLSIHWPAGIL